MLYLDYAKPLADGKYILSFFADSTADLESISHGQKFVTKNGTDYGVPQAGSTVIVTSPNSGKTTYVMDAEGIWVVTEDISYSAVVANPSDAATAKLEKLKVNDTTYANWTENEIKSIASESGGGKLYRHNIHMLGGNGEIYFTLYTSQKTAYTSVSPIFSILGRNPYQFVYYNGADGIGIGVVMFILDNNSFNIKLYKGSSTAVTSADITLQTPTSISDTVTEL